MSSCLQDICGETRRSALILSELEFKISYRGAPNLQNVQIYRMSTNDVNNNVLKSCLGIDLPRATCTTKHPALLVPSKLRSQRATMRNILQTVSSDTPVASTALEKRMERAERVETTST